MKKKFSVSMKVDGRITVEVEAETPEEAREKAISAFEDADLSTMDFVDAEPLSYTCDGDDGWPKEF